MIIANNGFSRWDVRELRAASGGRPRSDGLVAGSPLRIVVAGLVRARRPQMLGLAVCLVGLSSWSVAKAEDLLPGPEAARILADGRPWSGERPNGERLKVTFNPDGTGLWEGPLTRRTTWEVKGGAVCIHLGFPFGSRCIQLRRAGARLDGYEGAQLALVLSR